jgi:hypothetical protein
VQAGSMPHLASALLQHTDVQVTLVEDLGR